MDIEDIKTEKNESEKELESFDDFLTAVDDEMEQELQVPEPDRIQTVKEGLIHYFKLLKAHAEQEDFIIFYSKNIDLKEELSRLSENFKNTLIDLIIYHKNYYSAVELVDLELPYFDYLLLKPDDFEKHIQNKQKEIKKQLLGISNTLLAVTKEKLIKERLLPQNKEMLKFIKKRIQNAEYRTKLEKKLKVNAIDTQKSRINDLGALIYFHFRLSNDDLTNKSALSQLFEEVDVAREKKDKKKEKTKKKQTNN